MVRRGVWLCDMAAMCGRWCRTGTVPTVLVRQQSIRNPLQVPIAFCVAVSWNVGNGQLLPRVVPRLRLLPVGRYSGVGFRVCR